MKQLLSGQSVIFSAQRAGNVKGVSSFRYFPRTTFGANDLGGGRWENVFGWTKKNGVTLLYHYSVTTFYPAYYNYQWVHLTPPLPPVAGGYLFNFGIRPTLVSVEVV